MPANQNRLQNIAAELAWDPVRQRVIRISGFQPPQLTGRIWEWAGASWQQIADGAVTAAFHSVATDFARNKVILIGNMPSVLAEWNGASWTASGSGVVPHPRYLPAVGWHGSTGEILFHGGMSAFLAGTTPLPRGFHADSWRWHPQHGWRRIAPDMVHGVAVTDPQNGRVLVQMWPNFGLNMET
ncbi:MAG: hypothetical protein IPK26_16900 [Planctomycetes bacterium]|nr:hypothetical protein [Planctomycetota bacterium]